MNLPTKLTVLRLILSLVIIVLLCFPFYAFGLRFPVFDVYGVQVELQYIISGVIFIVASLTDWLDGYIARKYNYITDIGKLIDPLADKLTQVSLLLSLAILKILPWWIFAIVFIKELVLIVSASVLYSRKDVVVYSKWYGKLATTLFYLAIVVSLIINHFNITFSFRVDLYLYYLAILATVFALIMYSIKFEFKRDK